MREWYRIEVKAAAESSPEGDSVAEIHIIDYIGGWIDQTLNELFGEKVTVTAKAFIDDLAALPASVKALRVHINSPGGDVWGAINIANALRDQQITKGRTVETVIDGLAASSASLIAMAGKPCRMADNAIFMVHEPWSGAVGNAKEMRKCADMLDTLRDAQLVPTYQWHSKLSAQEITALLEAETWMDADEATANGFVDEKVEGLRVAASIDPRARAKLSIPEKFRPQVEALLRPEDPPAARPTAEPKVSDAMTCCTCCDGEQCCACCRGGGGMGCACEDTGADCACCQNGECCACCKGEQCCATCMGEGQGEGAKPAMTAKAPEPVVALAAAPADVVRLCAEAGLDLAFAQALIAEGRPLEAVTARITGEKDSRAAAAARERDIRALCTLAKQPDLADGYVAGAMTTAQVREHLSKITAKLDRAEIQAGIRPDEGMRPQPVIDIAKVYRERNAAASKN